MDFAGGGRGRVTLGLVAGGNRGYITLDLITRGGGGLRTLVLVRIGDNQLTGDGGVGVLLDGLVLRGSK